MAIAVEEKPNLEAIASKDTVQIGSPKMSIEGFYLMLNEMLGGRYKGTVPVFQKLCGETEFRFLGDFFYQPSEAGLMKGAYIFMFTERKDPLVKCKENNIVLARYAKKDFAVSQAGILIRQDSVTGIDEWIIGFPEYLTKGKEHQISTLIQNMYPLN